MNRRAAMRAAVLAVAVAGALALCAGLVQAQQVPPPTAIAHAKLMTQLPCYLRSQTVQISGSGYAAGASYSVILDRAVIGSGAAAADGSIAGSLSSGNLAHGVHEQRHRLQVTDGTNIGRVGFSTTAFEAKFSPAAGDPRTLSVRFSVFGIGLGHSGAAGVFLHYLDPRGHLLATVEIGHTAGACGNLARSSLRPLFPFHHVVGGKWQLQFDTRRDYSPDNQPRIVRTVAVAA